MAMRDKRIDVYILKSADFAIPILSHLRELIHVACPDVEETMKWSFPHFDYLGVMCSMASFRQHAVFGFWKASLMKDKSLMENAASETSMGHLGKITTLQDLPSDKVMKSYIAEAMQLNETGAKVARTKPVKGRKVVAPPDLKKAIEKNGKASKTFSAFSSSNRKEYVDWVKEAKTDETRARRIKTAVEWMAEGKIRNWKYVR